MQTYFYIIGSDGHVTKRDFKSTLGSDYSLHETSVSANGDIVYVKDGTLVLGNLETGNTRIISGVKDVPESLNWSSDGRYALLTGKDVALLDVNTSTLYYVANGEQNHDEMVTAYPPKQVWSPDNKHAVFVVHGNAYYIDVETRQVSPITKTTDRRTTSASWIWNVQDRVILDLCTYSDTLKEYGCNTKLVDGVTDSITTINTEHPTNSPLTISPDGSQIGYVNDGPIIQDTTTGNRVVSRPAYDSYNSSTDGNILWSANGRWMIAFDNGVVAGGGNFFYVGVLRNDGTSQRDLTSAWSPTANTIHWLPKTAQVDALPRITKTPIPKPTTTLHGRGWHFTLAWSPDSKQIGGITDNYLASSSSMTIWTIANDARRETPLKGSNSLKTSIHWKDDGQAEPILLKSRFPDLSNVTGGQILAISPDGRLAFALADELDKSNKPTGVYNTKTGALVYAVGYEGDWVESADFSPDGRLLAVGTTYFDATLFSTNDWSPVGKVPHHAPGLAFSPDGKQLAVTASWDVEIYNVADLLGR